MYRNSSEIISDVLFRGFEPANNGDYATAVVDWLNRAYRGIWSGGAELDEEIAETWWWLSTHGVLTLQPALSTGSVIVTNNSAGFQLNGAVTYSVEGWYLKADTHADVFRINSHVSGEATGTLESVYTGNSATAASFKIFKTDYDLPTTVLHISNPMRAYQDSRRVIVGISDEDLLKKYPRNEIGPGVPQNFSMVGERKVRFSHYGGATTGALIKVDYDYIEQPAELSNATTSVPVVPYQYRQILADWTLGILREAKEDSQAASAIIAAQRGLRTMARDNRRRQRMMGDARFAQIIPRMHQDHRDIGPVRSESGKLFG